MRNNNIQLAQFNHDKNGDGVVNDRWSTAETYNASPSYNIPVRRTNAEYKQLAREDDTYAAVDAIAAARERRMRERRDNEDISEFRGGLKTRRELRNERRERRSNKHNDEQNFNFKRLVKRIGAAAALGAALAGGVAGANAIDSHDHPEFTDSGIDYTLKKGDNAYGDQDVRIANEENLPLGYVQYAFGELNPTEDKNGDGIGDTPQPGDVINIPVFEEK